jgi:maltose-binding protein MalE
MKKYLFHIITAFLAISLITACSQGTGTNEQTSDAAVTVGETTAEEVTETTQVPDSLPDTDLGGYNFRILAFNDATNTQITQIYADEQTGSGISDAVYKKITTVEERFNVDISLAEGSITDPKDTSDQNSVIQKSILSGDDTFDIVTAHDISMGNYSLEGYFINIYNLPHLDYTKPWWPASTVDGMTVGDKMYLISNNISYFGLSSTRVMFFNKTAMTDLGIEMPYTYVNDGSWTLDKLNELTKLGYKDVNGDGAVDDTDSFGFLNSSYYYGYLEPFNIEPYKRDADGNIYYEFDTATFSALAEKFYSLIFGQSGYKAANGDASKVIFNEGRALFTYETLGSAMTSYSFSDTVYGILPMPKLDASAAIYYAGCTDRPVAVPVTLNPENYDKTGIVIEALSAEGYKQVFPAVFEVALKTRYADQSEDAEMLDLIQSNVILSFNYIYGNYASPYLALLENLFNAATPSSDVASWAAKNEAAQIARCQVINDKIGALEQ